MSELPDRGGLFDRHCLGQELPPRLGIPDRAPRRKVQQRVRRGWCAVDGCARPRERLRLRHQTGADGVELRVTEGGPEVGRVKRARIEAALPDVPRGQVKGVKVGSVTSMDLLERCGERVGLLRDGD